MKRRYRLYQIVEVGAAKDFASRFYDFLSTGLLILNLLVSVLYTFAVIRTQAGTVLFQIERLTVIFFAIDCGLRAVTAKCAHMNCSEGKALAKYFLSFAGIVDLLSFVPYFLPVFFPSGLAVFRMFRVVRIFRLFRLNAYYDSLNVITEVLKSKKQQLLSSIFIICVLILAASMCMYSLEHSAQPDVFENAFSGIWWAVSTLLTVGYGDIYPITPAGQVFSIIITFLGVLLVAVPSGIISAGFVEMYTRFSKLGGMNINEKMHFIQTELKKGDDWVGMKVADLRLPDGMMIAMIQRKNEVVIPRGDVILQQKDVLVIGAESTSHTTPLEMETVILDKKHPWNGETIENLDISRQTFIVAVRRHDMTIVPKGSLQLFEGDEVVLYNRKPS